MIRLAVLLWGIAATVSSPALAEGMRMMAMCPMDAKLCNDGSYVSRAGPHCAFAPCPSEDVIHDKDGNNKGSEVIQKAITGSMESPDPVLERILELEKQGVISNVIVMESFPVLVHIKAPRRIIEELEALPRVRGDGL